MVFTSNIPAYLDPANWQQHPNHHPSSSASHHAIAPPPPPPPPPQPHGGGGGAGSIRPGSLADRARMANIPMAETALNCPRCESANTKFCYFNNYSLTQPRHFCKTCRRYWTRGGALRNVPVGGGCRRNNKRSSKGRRSSSKSPVTTGTGDHRQSTASGNSSSTTISTSNNSTTGGSTDILGLGVGPQRFMAPFQHHINDQFGDTGLNNYGTINSAPLGGTSDLSSFQIGTGGGGGTSLLSMAGFDQWRLHHQAAPPQFPFPFLGGFESCNSGLYGQYESGGGVEPSAGYGHQVRAKIATQMASASVKMEDHKNNSPPFLGVNPGNVNDQYWGGSGTTTWTDLSSFNNSSSTTNNPL